jgi:hypothetical protein
MVDQFREAVQVSQLRRTQTEEYWGADFQIEQADIDHLYSILFERETPLSDDEMALALVRYRVQREEEELARRAGAGNVYQPRKHYEVGEEITFPALGHVSGKVMGVRPGNNPDYGHFNVVQVQFEGDKILEFASDLAVEHKLNVDETPQETNDQSLLTPEEIFIEYGGNVADVLRKRLAEHDDLVRLAGKWFPRSLLVEVNIGHLHLAEAVLDVNGGGPMTASEILEQIGMLDNVSERLAEFSLNYSLQQDERFDEVGPAGQVLWYLTRMEPPEVQQTPPRLVYTPEPYDPSVLTSELRELEVEIGDELSEIVPQRSPRPQSVTVTLTYAHHCTGTLPLSVQLRRMFPTAYESERIRFTLVDALDGEEIPAWVVRPGGYVYGLKEWFKKHDIPVGGYLTIHRTDEPGRVQISYARRNPRIEWVRTALVQNNQLSFENRKRAIGCEYDDLMIIDVADPQAVEALWQRHTTRATPLERLMQECCRELAPLNPQGTVHAKTLYSAINLVRRCPPGPIFARLVTSPQFEHVGGPYWRLRESSS